MLLRLFIFMLFLSLPAWAGEARSPEEAMRLSQAAIGREVSNHRFIKSDGQAFTLDSTKGKPTIISLIYTSCYHTCPLITETLAKAAIEAATALGHDKFRVITIGFDTKADNPEAMRLYAKQHGNNKIEWHFLSGDALTIERLADETGFTYYPSSRGFDHLTQTTILDSEGKIYRQVYGDAFDIPHLVEPLKDLVLGRAVNFTSVEGIWTRVKLFCTIYDPRNQSYRFDYGIFIEMIVGGLCVLGIGVFWVRLIRSANNPRNNT